MSGHSDAGLSRFLSGMGEEEQRKVSEDLVLGPFFTKKAQQIVERGYFLASMNKNSILMFERIHVDGQQSLL